MGLVWFSSAKPRFLTSSTIPPAALNGYGPRNPARNLMISGCLLKDAWTFSPSDGGPCVPAVQPPAWEGLPAGGPVVVQPSKVLPSFSKDVEPAPAGTVMSSTDTPSKGMALSLT